MTVYFHHVGDENAKRDFPRTIGASEVRQMVPNDFGPFAHLVPDTIGHFQTWGIPLKAAGVHAKLRRGDWYALVGTTKGGGGMEYIGKIIHIIPDQQRELSKHLWTEDRFPWIFLLEGRLRFIPWPEFLDRIGYAPNFDPHGRVYGISQQKMLKRRHSTDDSFVEALLV